MSHTLGVHSSKDSNRALPAQGATATGCKLKFLFWSHSNNQLQEHWETRLREEAARIVSSLYKTKTLLGTSKKDHDTERSVTSEMWEILVLTCLEDTKSKIWASHFHWFPLLKDNKRIQKLMRVGEKEEPFCQKLQYFNLHGILFKLKTMI